MSNDYPKLRPLEAVPVAVQGQQMVALRDPMGYAAETCCVPPQQYFILALCDGEHSILDIQAAYMRQFGELLVSDDVRQLVAELDRYHFMDSEAFAEHRAQLHTEFRDAPVRKPCNAGNGYPESPDDIHEMLDACLAKAEPHSAPAAPGAIIAPHIDYTRGAVGYGHAYAALRHTAARLFVVLGVAHAPTDTPFVGTLKPFETPLGVAQTDEAAVEQLASASGLDLFHDEYVHKSEHSIEFQVVFLQHLFGEDARIVPVLCSAFESFTGPNEVPSDSPPLQAFFDALRRLVAERDEPVAVIAGADLAHVGPQFGDPQKLAKPFLDRVETGDREMLDHVVALDAPAFYRQVMQDDNARRVCGLSPIYTLLASCDFSSVRLLHYDQAVDEEGLCGVSFASVALYPSR